MIKKGAKAMLLAGILLLVLTGCEKMNDNDDCDSVTPVCSCAYIGIVDSEGNSLLGADNVYDPAEISLSNEGQLIELIEDDLGRDDLYLRFFFGEMVSGEDYLLQLNETETDILNLEITENIGPCFTTYTIQKFNLNGTEIIAVEEVYLIEK
ncbi:MAG: hypothetical protein ACI86C_000713 [Candidatus Latescibacterota bacterium]|jgi:hypothetical protein